MKKIGKNLVIDLVGCLLIAVGIYNFAVMSEFPVSGISGIAIVFYHYWNIPIGLMTFLLNVPIVLWCYQILGRRFMIRSIQTILISTLMMDVVAPLLPVYHGDIFLSCVCMGVLAGLGFGMIYRNNTSTGGVDFVMMAIHAKKPYLSLGSIIIILDFSIVILSGLLVGGELDHILYGMVATYIMSVVVDKAMYQSYAGKMSLIVTKKGKAVCDKIWDLTQRGSTILEAQGSYTQENKQIVMCACDNKQMHFVREAVKKVDEEAFMIILESNEVRGEGFRPH